jgi:hypothetical protein
MDINRNVARKIVFEPKTLGGLEMHDLYTIQCTERLQYFLGHVMCNDGNGNHMHICMESTQLEVGLCEPFLFLNYKVSGSHLLNKTWITAIWGHLSLSNGTITTNTWLPRPQRAHDTALMAIASSTNFTNKQKQHINVCRIYLQTISTSDTTTFDGNSITQRARNGKLEDITSALRWPNQQRPPKAWWDGTHGDIVQFAISTACHAFCLKYLKRSNTFCKLYVTYILQPAANDLAKITQHITSERILYSQLTT